MTPLPDPAPATAALDPALHAELAAIVGDPHVLTGSDTAGYVRDWTGKFHGHTPAVVRPADTGEVAAVLSLCARSGTKVVPQGGNTGLVGGGVPLDGEVVLSLTRLSEVGDLDVDAGQVTAGAGVALSAFEDLHPDWELGCRIASRHSATIGGAVATNAGGLRVLRYGSMRHQVAGLEAVLSDGTVVSHLGGLRKDNTGYDYPSLLTGSEGTLAVITRVRVQLVPRVTETVTLLVGVDTLEAAHRLAVRARRELTGLISAEFFTETGLEVLLAHTDMVAPLRQRTPVYVLLETEGTLEEDRIAEAVADLVGESPCVVATAAKDRDRLWSYRERHPEAAGFLGAPLKLDVSVPDRDWVRFAGAVPGAVHAVDPGAAVILFGHLADGNVHVNIVPAAPADGRHQDAVFSRVGASAGSISAEHGIGALKAPWLHLSRTPAEQELFRRVRRALDPAGILNPAVLPS